MYLSDGYAVMPEQSTVAIVAGGQGGRLGMAAAHPWLVPTALFGFDGLLHWRYGGTHKNLTPTFPELRRRLPRSHRKNNVRAPRFPGGFMRQESTVQHETLLGHPVGLYTLFFAEMWERFSYYGMRALLVFYMLKGFLGYGDSEAYAVYGAYTALVYMTPFFGGMIADRLLGPRRAVVLGGMFMAAGHLMMTIENNGVLHALALLIAGNGFFKPNISTMVGSLYPPGSPKRDGGFTIFYMGVNLGAAMSPLLCGYIGEKYGWHYGFGLATIGMLTGVAVFVAPSITSQLMMAAVDIIAAINIFVVPQYVEAGSTLRNYMNWGVLACSIVAAAVSLCSWDENDRPNPGSRRCFCDW